MTEQEHVQLILVMVGLAGTWFVYSVVYQRTRQRAFREDLFTIRDELFDYMRQQGLSFDLPAYGRMRYLINGLIRFSERIQFVPTMLLLFATRRDAYGGDRLSSAIAEIQDPAVRAHFESVQAHVAERLLKFVFLEGPQALVFKPIQLYGRRVRGSRRPHLGSPEIIDEVMQLGKSNSSVARFLVGDQRRRWAA